jgi:hypothetical protein
VKLTSTEKILHLRNFKNALLRVSPEYFGIPALNGKIDLIERAFAYELYHQLRLVYHGQNWYVNGELRKGLTFFPSYQLNKTLIPDLIIHKHGTTSENILAVEIKVNPRVTIAEIISDLKKLELYTRPGDKFLNYSIGILLLINLNFRERIQLMKSKSRDRINKLLNFHRIAIWNIHKPLPVCSHGINLTINTKCLEIYRNI